MHEQRVIRSFDGSSAIQQACPPARAASLTVTALVPTLLSFTGHLKHEHLVACVDYVVGPAAAWRVRSDRDTLRLSLERYAGSRGVQRLLTAVDDARGRVESPMETMLRLLLLEKGLAEPTINLELRAPGSRESFRLDLAYPQLKIAIEYDLNGYRTDLKQFQRDRCTDDVLHEIAWRVVRVTSAGLRRTEMIVARLVHLGAPRVR